MSYNDLFFFKENLWISDEFNTRTSHNGAHYFRILKSFVSPSQPQWKGETIGNSGRKVEPSLLKRFPLRFYLPLDDASRKSSYNSKGNDDGPRIKHLVVMINGLDEYKEKYLELYDAMGSLLAEKNIASVLLSTPFHLHRTVMFETERKKNNGQPIHSILKPSNILLDSWENMFYAYDTTYRDLKELIKSVKGKSQLNKDDYDFYKTHFSKSTKISILGYSLGGLFSFGYYLQEILDINKCILFNAPGNLLMANTSEIRVNSKKWTDMWNVFDKEGMKIKTQLSRQGIDEAQIDVFLNLITNRSSLIIRSRLDNREHKILQIACGGDSVIDMKPWSVYFDKPEPKGIVKKLISQHVFAGIGHLPVLESRGSELMPNIVRLISDHILAEENQSHWQKVDIDKNLRELLKIIENTAFYNELMSRLDDTEFDKSFKKEDLSKTLACFDETGNSDKRKLFLRFYHLYHMYNKKFYDLLDDIKIRE
jgi:hypothetical protein